MADIDITRQPLSSMAGRTVLVVGGTGAIGAATARRFAALGATVVIGHRGSAARAAAVLAGLADTAEHFDIALSITDSASLDNAAARLRERCGKLDVLVNTAGFTRPVAAHDLDALTDELIDAIFAANWRGVFATIRAFRPLLAASDDGLVVNVSSIAAQTGAGSNLAYVAAKAGIDVLGKALGKALAPGIRVLTVAPGVVDSTFVPGRGEDFNAKAAAATPLKRVGTAEDVALAIEACATTLRFATGAVIVVDGGRSL